jgi:hypothetical protein
MAAFAPRRPWADSPSDFDIHPVSRPAASFMAEFCHDAVAMIFRTIASVPSEAARCVRHPPLSAMADTAGLAADPRTVVIL